MTQSAPIPKGTAHRRRNIGLVFVGALVLIIVVGAVAVSLPGQQAKQGMATGPLLIVVTQATVDQTPLDAQPGYSVLIYNVTITNPIDSNARYTSGLLYFSLTGSTNAPYVHVVVPSVKEWLPPILIGPGEHASGQIAFRGPSNELPMKLEYRNSGELVDETVTDLPQPTNWVTEVGAAKATVSGAAGGSYIAKASVQNTAGYNLFFSNNTTPIRVGVTSVGSGAPSVTVNSISVDHGFTVASVTPALPKTLVGDGQEVDFIVTVRATPSSVNVDTLSITLLTG
jgi:hypothetical protein